MANGTINVKIDDFGTFPVSASLSRAELKRSLATVTGCTWLDRAEVCEVAGGDLHFKRPAAATKGAR